MNTEDLKWNVYYHSFNSDELKTYNIFKHGSFVEDVEKYLKKYKNKEEFAEKLKSSLMYYFWSKCEWEVIITKKDNRIIMSPWVGSRKNPELDVTDDANFNWIGFYNKMIEKYIRRDEPIKIDVYEQVTFRWDDFVDYIWNSKVRRPKQKEKIKSDVLGEQIRIEFEI